MPSLSAVLLVLIGSLAGIGLQTVIVAIRHKRRELRDVRAAARITANDFDRAANYMSAVAELAWFDPQTDLAIPAWDEHRTLLACLIDDPPTGNSLRSRSERPETLRSRRAPA